MLNTLQNIFQKVLGLFIKKSNKVLALDLGQNIARVVFLEKTGDKLKLLGHACQRFSMSEDSGDAELVNFLQDFLNKHRIQPHEAALSISDANVLTIVCLPVDDLATKEEILQSVQDDLQEEVVFELDETYVDYKEYRKVQDEAGESKKECTFVVMRKDTVHECVAALGKCQLQVAGITSNAFGYCELLDLLPETPQHCAILDLDLKHSTLSFVNENKVLFSRSMPISWERISKSLMEILVSDRGKIELGYDAAEEIKRSIGFPLGDYDENMPVRDHVQLKHVVSMLRPILEVLVRELRFSFDYYATNFDQEFPERLYITGGGANLRNLDFYLSRELEVEVVFFPLPDFFSAEPLKAEEVVVTPFPVTPPGAAPVPEAGPESTPVPPPGSPAQPPAPDVPEPPAPEPPPAPPENPIPWIQPVQPSGTDPAGPEDTDKRIIKQHIIPPDTLNRQGVRSILSGPVPPEPPVVEPPVSPPESASADVPEQAPQPQEDDGAPPFSADEASSDRTPESEEREAAVRPSRVITSPASFNPVLNQILPALGTAVSHSCGINLLPPEEKLKKVAAFQRALCRGIGVLVNSVLLILAIIASVQYGDYDVRLNNARMHLVVIKEIEEAQVELKKKHGLVEDIRKGRVPAEGILKTLSVRIPSEIVIRKFAFFQTQSAVTLEGTVAETADRAEAVLTEFMQDLEASSFFGEVTLKSMEGVGRMQKFAINCEVVTHAE